MKSFIPISWEAEIKSAAEKCFGSTSPFRITLLNQQVVEDWRAQWTEKTPPGFLNFHWDDVEKRQYPPRDFSWAFYAGKELCGLAAGYVDPHPLHQSSINIDIIEGAHHAHPLKGRLLTLMVDAAEDIAGQHHLFYARIQRPRSVHFPMLEGKGYRFYGAAPECNFFEKEITPQPN